MTKPRIAGLIVIVAGILVAVLFRGGPNETDASSETANSADEIDDSSEPTSTSPVPDPQKDNRLDVSHVSQEQPVIREPEVANSSAEIEPPSIAQNYEPAFSVPDRPTIPVPSPPVEQEPPATISHKIRNGDSLGSLSKRYYGSIAFARYIFQANQDQLRHPDLLPLGTTIRIPPEPAHNSLGRHQAQPPPASHSQTAPPVAGTNDVPNTRMSPVVPLTK